MNIIIAGDGRVGSTLTRQLSAEGYDLTVIDCNQTVLEDTIARYDVMSVNGNCASMPTTGTPSNKDGSKKTSIA